MLKEDGDRTVLGLVRESVAHSPRSLIESRLGPESSISGSALPPAGAFSNGTGSCPKSSDRARSTPSSSDRSSSVRYKVSVNAWNSRAVRLSKREISFIEAMPPWRSFSCRPGLRWCRSIQLVAASRSSWRSHSRSSAASALSSLSAATANTLTTDTMLTTTAHTRGLEELGSEKTFPRALTAAEVISDAKSRETVLSESLPRRWSRRRPAFKSHSQMMWSGFPPITSVLVHASAKLTNESVAASYTAHSTSTVQSDSMSEPHCSRMISVAFRKRFCLIVRDPPSTSSGLDGSAPPRTERRCTPVTKARMSGMASVST
mmetsp:Transcript_15110/g.57401  ORF Transcript_15110/g.57401 Transcript_15110/m.57401 type:complete len:318 (-) Transcript_15110:2519-3472(-)